MYFSIVINNSNIEDPMTLKFYQLAYRTLWV